MRKAIILTIFATSLAIMGSIFPAAAIEEAKEIIRSGEPSVSYYDLATWYSPVIVQDVGCPKMYLLIDNETVEVRLGYADYITRIDYDGDYVGNNNQDNLGYPEKARPLPAYVYYAVLETDTHYFIWYALYHTVDDYLCEDGWGGHSATHEDDLEGMVMCVHKDGSYYGELRMVQLQAHKDFYQYTPPGETGIYDDDDDIDGTIALDSTYPGVHPVVYVEGGGHGIRHEDIGDWPSVYYYYTGTAEDPDEVGFAPDGNCYHCGYDLLSIFAEMWEQRTNCCGSGYLFDNWGNYMRWGFNVQGLGRNFDSDDFGGPDQTADSAKTPWYWDDWNDGDDWLNGDWFMHAAGYHGFRFEWAEPFSTTYIFHPFGYDHLGGDIYNGKGGTTTLSHGPYRVVFDVTILSDQLFDIEPGVTVKFNSDTSIIADALMEADGNGNSIYFVQYSNPGTGMKIDGEAHIENGGVIRFP
jgi:hypothetical protein